MTAWPEIPAARRELLEALAREYRHNYPRGRTILAVDGPDGAGKTRFADDLALALARTGIETVRASLDDFHRPQVERYARGRFSPEGYYVDAFDYSALKRVLIEPFRMGEGAGFTTAVFDLARDRPRESAWRTAGADVVLVIDGVFLQRPELAGLWNAALWVDADPRVRAARLEARDRIVPGSERAGRYLDAQRRYVRDVHPNTTAWAIIDLSDADAPVRRYADFCSIQPLPFASA